MKGGVMKYSFKFNPQLNENEIVIEHNADDQLITDLHQALAKQQRAHKTLKLFYNDEQIFLNVNDILFFETDNNKVYAHTNTYAYESDYKLYELIESLPEHFIRISKSTICNTQYVLAISRYLSSSGTVKFKNSVKTVYVSRLFYNELKASLEKRSLL